jgi:endonuclease G
MAKKKKKNRIWGWAITLALCAGSFIVGQTWSDWDISRTLIQLNNKRADTSRMEIPVMPEEKQGQIIQRTGYTLAYDAKNKTPQWVAWELTDKETRGKEERTNDFQPDPEVIGTKVATYDYSGSGYDRGHMAPAGDMKWSKQAMQESFYMTNICPQDHNLNTEDWNDLEMKSREWARRYGKVHIVCGPIYKGIRNEYIGEHRVKVPDAFFKVILIDDARKSYALGFLFENKAGERPLKEYLVSVDEIERITGMDFFSVLPDNLEDRLEAETLRELP